MRTSPLARQVQIHKAIGHPARLRVVAMLGDGELCVCQITAVLRLAASTVSAHLAELKGAGLVEERKSGRWVYYSLTATGAGTLGPMLPELLRDAALAEDRRLLAVLRTTPVESICRSDFDLAQAASAKECCS
jgi:DNA-binding transcriptional ArsR family regulator